MKTQVWLLSMIVMDNVCQGLLPKGEYHHWQVFFPLKEVFPAVNLLSPMSGQPDVRVAELSDLQAQLLIFFAAFPAKLEGSKSQNNVPKTTQL